MSDFGVSHVSKRQPRLARFGLSRTCAPVAVACLLASVARGQSYWEMTPYQVRIVVAVEPSPLLPVAAEANLIAELEQRLSSFAGAVCRAEVVAAPSAQRYRITRDIASFIDNPEQVSKSAEGESPAEDQEAVADSLPQEPRAPPEKLILLGVRPVPTGFRIVAKQYDQRVARWSDHRTRVCRQRQGWADAAWQTLWNAFTPLGKISVGRDGAATMRMRASGLASEASPIGIPHTGQVFLPIVRRNERSGKPRENGIQPVPWTMVVVSEVEGLTAKCEVHSGVRRPLDIARRARTELYGIAVDQPQGETRLVLRSRTDDSRPLAGYTIVARSPVDESLEDLGRTDARGEIVIPANDYPLRLLIIKHGSALLGKVPMSPGALKEIVVAIPDDDLRLKIEGQLAGLRDNMVDLAAQRQVLLARIQHGIEQEDIKKADELLDQFKELPTKETFTRRLEDLRKSSQVEDVAIQRQIDKLFEDTAAVMTRYLKASPVDDLQKQLDAARRG